MDDQPLSPDGDQSLPLDLASFEDAKQEDTLDVLDETDLETNIQHESTQ